MKRTFSIFFYNLIIFSCLLTVIIPKISSGAQSEIKINPDKYEIEADVGPGAGNRVVFTGYVECEPNAFGENVHEIKVELNVSINDGWNATIDPKTIIFERMGESYQDFEIFITAPRFLNIFKAGTLHITGKAKSSPGMIHIGVEPTWGIITIKPYMVMNVTGPKNHILCKPGDQINYVLNITNNANYNGRFKSTFSNSDQEVFNNWIVDFSSRSFIIQEGKSWNNDVTIYVPKDASAGKYRIVIDTITENLTSNNTMIIKQYYLFIEVEAMGIFGLGTWSWYALVILIVVIISVVVWKRKNLVSRFKRLRKKR